MEAFIFFVFGALTLAGAFGVILARNPVHSAISLVVTLVSVAVLFLQQDAHLLAAVQVVVYAGAIVVLFLFVIMLLGVDHPDHLRDPMRFQRTAAIVIGVVLLAEVLFLTGHQWATGAQAPASDAIRGGTPGLGNNVERIAAVVVHRLPLAVRDHRRAARARGDRLGRPRPSQPFRRGRRDHGGRAVTLTLASFEITSSYYLVLAALLFTIGAIGLLTRRNVLVMFMCVELMLNAVNLTFVSFANELNDIRGQVIVFFVLSVAAAEVAVGLGIIVAIFRRRRGATADDLDLLKDPTS